jgi:hypothetical protein
MADVNVHTRNMDDVYIGLSETTVDSKHSITALYSSFTRS